MPHRSGFQLGPWLLTSKLAKGGMGEVFVGLRLGRGAAQQPVAIKVLLEHLADDKAAVERFFAEAELAARMTHPNLVRLFEVGVHDGRPWQAMELLRGVSLSSLLSASQHAEAPLPPELLTLVGHALADGLAWAHGLTGTHGRPLGLVHGDVTPHNVLVTSAGEVKLGDFGVARVQGGEERREQGPLRGKLEYLSPEQLLGEPTDARTDLYAAGVTLYTLAAGAEPFHRSTPQLTARAIRQEEPRPLAELRPDLPPALVAAIQRAMARRPEDRFGSAAELRAALGKPSTGAPARLGEAVRTLCAPELARLEEAVAMAESLAPQTEGMVPPPPSRPPMPRPRGTIELQRAPARPALPWKWLLAALAGLLLAGGLWLARWV